MVEGLNGILIRRITLHLVFRPSESEAEHGLEIQFCLSVLHTSAIVALIFVLHLLLVGHDNLVVFLQVLILITALTHLFFRESRLVTIALVYLGLQNTELVKFCLLCIAKSAIARGTMLESEPEIRILFDNLRIVTDSSPEVTRLF